MINTNIKKLYQQTTGLIEGLDDNIQLLSIGFIVSDKFCVSACGCLLFTSLPCMDNNSLAKQARE